MNWLPVDEAWDSRLDSTRRIAHPADAWNALASLSRHDLDFVQCGKLDRLAQKFATSRVLQTTNFPHVRLALLGSSTLRHLIPGIRVAGLRRGLWVEVFEGDYGLYLQELLDDGSKLRTFQPEVLCIALDSFHLLEISQGNIQNALERMYTCWRLAKDNFSAMVIQQSALPIAPGLLGNNEHRMSDSPRGAARSVESRIGKRSRCRRSSPLGSGQIRCD